MNRKKKGIIYTITNKKTNQTYVGATTVSLKKRLSDHKSKSMEKNNNKFYNSVATYGIEVFDFKEIDASLSLDELAQKERAYIKKYKTLGLSLNSDCGGGFSKTIYKYNIKGKLIAKYKSLKEAAIASNVNAKQISKICLNVNKKLGNFYYSYEYKEPFIGNNDKRRKQVVQFSLDSGKTISVFESVTMASKLTGINKTSIAKCCRNERKTAGGYKWEYNLKS